MDFTCKICGRSWSISELDYSFYESHNFECNLCYSLIAKRRYPINQKGAEVLFSPMGNALGDRIMHEVIKRNYVKDNPDEKVYFPDNAFEARDLRKAQGFNKIFWGDVTIPIETGFQREYMNPPTGAMWFSVSGEATAYAKMGIYPELPFQPTKPGIKLPKKYVAVHFRNIHKGDEKKNVSEILAYKILNLLNEYDLPVLLVGNDSKYETIEGEIDSLAQDLRGYMSIPRLAWVLREAALYVGSDSGLAHLAAVSGCQNIVTWNYTNENWFPKCPPERLTSFVRQENIYDKLEKAIGERTKSI